MNNPAKNESDCTKMNHNCVFDKENLKCKEIQEPLLDCSETTK